ncbi:MAG: hypothetical protein LBJ11_11015 [Oscillospiraceae bacterium]|jgi:hypothetical protein|nr:hypothetical protein [Oscillospiraceae bacterium]
MVINGTNLDPKDRRFEREAPAAADLINAYLIGAVNAWCNITRDDPSAYFSASTFAGGLWAHNWEWPLQALWEFYGGAADAEAAHDASGKELGHILYHVLWKHSFSFQQTGEEFGHHTYRWIR